MGETMNFPDTWEDFEKQFGITDTEKIYTNGIRLIPSFRVKQWLEHICLANNNDLVVGGSVVLTFSDGTEVEAYISAIRGKCE